MANTYTQIHIQFVFAVKFRNSLIHPSWKEELYRYITGIVQAKGHKMISINGMPDHLHILMGYKPTDSISNLMKSVKGDSAKWVNQKRFSWATFSWQEGYAAFSYSKSQVKDVVHYIENQEAHHRRRTFKEEYEDFLKKYQVEYKQDFLFKDPE